MTTTCDSPLRRPTVSRNGWRWRSLLIDWSEMDRSGDISSLPKIAALAPRELDCLRGVTQHKRTPQIAHDLGLRPKTVDTYIANACRKLGVADRDSAARLLIDHEQRLAGKSLSDFSGVEGGADRPSTPLVSRLPWPFPTQGRPANDLSLLQLLVAIALAAGFMMAVAAIYLLALAQLSSEI
jgi:DNA-binding CsgD family transcriptional regulator